MKVTFDIFLNENPPEFIMTFGKEFGFESSWCILSNLKLFIDCYLLKILMQLQRKRLYKY